MNLPDIQLLDSIVTEAARRELLPGFGKKEYRYKADGSVITAADESMQNALIEALEEHWPEYAILGEEMSEQAQQHVVDSEQGYWCVDPLDGTNNYATGMPFFSVSIALVIDGVTRFGYIHDPMHEESFWAFEGQGAYLNGDRLKPSVVPTPDNKLVAEVDMKRLPNELATRLVTQPPYGSQRNIGSSALDWCWLAAGRYDIYLHGGQKLWDYGAGHLICSETGGVSCSLDGQPVFRNQLETRSVLASLDHALFERWQKWLGLPL